MIRAGIPYVYIYIYTCLGTFGKTFKFDLARNLGAYLDAVSSAWCAPGTSCHATGQLQKKVPNEPTGPGPRFSFSFWGVHPKL